MVPLCDSVLSSVSQRRQTLRQSLNVLHMTWNQLLPDVDGSVAQKFPFFPNCATLFMMTFVNRLKSGCGRLSIFNVLQSDKPAELSGLQIWISKEIVANSFRCHPVFIWEKCFTPWSVLWLFWLSALLPQQVKHRWISFHLQTNAVEFNLSNELPGIAAEIHQRVDDLHAFIRLSMHTVDFLRTTGEWELNR